MRIILSMLFAMIVSASLSQFCSTLSLANMGAIAPTTTWQNVTGAASFKRYWTFTGVAGCTYDFSTCNSVNTNDTYLRLYSTATGGTILAQNDDNGPFCGGTKASLSWVCPANGTYSILLTNYSCANLSASTILSFRRTCATYNPCTSITTIPACGTNVSATMSGTGAGWNLTSCGFTTPGQERIFQFTPTTTGTYTFNITSIAGGWIDFFWKPASSGCNATGWNCIEDASVAGSYTPVVPMNFTAGVTYYILVDPEVTTVTNVTFNIGCPPVYNPCSSITTIPSCGTNVSATLTGSGAGWSPGTCGFSTPGQERIFQFTPTTTGTYTINVISISGGFTDFFWKPASSGCNATGWNCIDDIAATGSYNAITPMTFTAGVTYYILLDGESTATRNIIFNIGCPPVYNPCTSITTIPACGTNVSAAMIGGGAGWSPGSCGWGTPGQERMFQFTPTITATYSLNVTAISGGYINFFWKPASSGCNATGWNCIDDINVTGAYPATTPMALTAGVTYYILVDPEVTTATTVTFNIGCPTTGPCLNPTPYSVANMPTITTPSVTSTCASGFGQFTNEYSQWNSGVISTPYTVLSSIPTDWITITVGSPTGTVVQTGTSPLNFIAPSNNTYYVHINVNGYCADDANCRNVTVTRISALPVELMYFEGLATEQGNLLIWKTATENNSDYYLLEHSVTGEFNENSVIGMKKAAGNSTSEIAYSFIDNEFESIINYYRLTQVDIDGKFETFGPIAIDNSSRIKKLVKLINSLGQDVSEPTTTGMYIEVYDDGTIKRVWR